MGRIKAIVFDFDGVLADSEPLHLHTYQEVLSQFGVTLSREEYYANYLGYDDQGVFAQLMSRHGIELGNGLHHLLTSFWPEKRGHDPGFTRRDRAEHTSRVDPAPLSCWSNFCRGLGYPDN